MPDRSRSELVVSLDAVSKSYRLGEIEVPALNRVSFQISPQTFAVVIGPSGSGKTTLLNLIGGIDLPDTGAVRICGQRTSDLRDNALSDFRAHRIGFIFQNFNLIPVLSVYENVEYPLLLTATPEAERKARTLEMIDAVGLSSHRNHRPSQLSGGQRQRVAIARALVKRPELVLADEPTANLDTETGGTIINLMRQMQQNLRTTFVFSSHDPNLMDYAEETFVLRDGALIDHRVHAAA